MFRIDGAGVDMFAISVTRAITRKLIKSRTYTQWLTCAQMRTNDGLMGDVQLMVIVCPQCTRTEAPDAPIFYEASFPSIHQQRRNPNHKNAAVNERGPQVLPTLTTR